MREDPPLKVTVVTVVAERQASAGARDGVKGKGAISLRALRCMRLFGVARKERQTRADVRRLPR